MGRYTFITDQGLSPVSAVFQPALLLVLLQRSAPFASTGYWPAPTPTRSLFSPSIITYYLFTHKFIDITHTPCYIFCNKINTGHERDRLRDLLTSREQYIRCKYCRRPFSITPLSQPANLIIIAGFRPRPL